jgi:hypothetical protein
MGREYFVGGTVVPIGEFRLWLQEVQLSAKGEALADTEEIFGVEYVLRERTVRIPRTRRWRWWLPFFSTPSSSIQLVELVREYTYAPCVSGLRSLHCQPRRSAIVCVRVAPSQRLAAAIEGMAVGLAVLLAGAGGHPDVGLGLGASMTANKIWKFSRRAHLFALGGPLGGASPGTLLIGEADATGSSFFAGMANAGQRLLSLLWRGAASTGWKAARDVSAELPTALAELRRATWKAQGAYASSSPLARSAREHLASWTPGKASIAAPDPDPKKLALLIEQMAMAGQLSKFLADPQAPFEELMEACDYASGELHTEFPPRESD